MSLGRELTQNDVGKFFVVRDPQLTCIEKVRVDALLPDRYFVNERVVVTRFLTDGRKLSSSCCINGATFEDSSISHDLVDPYEKPELKLGPENEALKARVVALELALEFYAGDYDGKEGSMWDENRFFLMDKFGITHDAEGPKVAKEALGRVKGE